MEKPTTKLSAPDCVILFCVATGIHNGSVGMAAKVISATGKPGRGRKGTPNVKWIY
jgi:hypothetical protein